MNLELYTIADDPRVVSKTVGTAVASFADVPRASVTVMGGTVTVESATSLAGCNYAYISDFNRYYFIDQITAVREGLWSISLRVDVLMSFASDITALTGTINRNEDLADAYLADGKYISKVYRQITTKAFPNSMNADNIILMTVG